MNARPIDAAPVDAGPTAAGPANPAATDLDAAIARYAAFSFEDATQLPAAGLESLALLRLAVDVAAGDAEIDASALAGLRTVGDLKLWLTSIAASEHAEEGA